MRAFPTDRQREYLDALGVNAAPPRAHFRVPVATASSPPHSPSPPTSPAVTSPTAPAPLPFAGWSFSQMIGLVFTASCVGIAGYLCRAVFVFVKSFVAFGIVVAVLVQPNCVFADVVSPAIELMPDSAISLQPSSAFVQSIDQQRNILTAPLLLFVLLTFFILLAIYQVYQLRLIRSSMKRLTVVGESHGSRGVKKQPEVGPTGSFCESFHSIQIQPRLNIAHSDAFTLPMVSTSPKEPTKRVAARSVRGMVRIDNQDCCDTSSLLDHDIIILADGMGGVPNGTLASSTAVTASMELIDDQLRLGVCPSKCLEHAFFTAAKRLHDKALELDSEYDFLPADAKKRFGLRTTLIAVIATRESFHIGYIGDGSIHVSRDRQLLSLLTPDRPGSSTNVVSASLGPDTAGNPTFNTVSRLPSDILIAATDGIADRVSPDTFANQLISSLKSGVDVENVIASALNACSTRTGNDGTPAFDDNMTLAIINSIDSTTDTLDNRKEMAICTR